MDVIDFDLYHKIKSTLDNFGLSCDSELFSYLNETDVIQINSIDDIILYRSESFYKMSTYDPETLDNNPWFSLFEREREIEKKMIEFDFFMNREKPKKMIKLNFPWHLVHETSSIEKKTFMYKPTIFCPVLRNSEFAGKIYIGKVTNI